VFLLEAVRWSSIVSGIRSEAAISDTVIVTRTPRLNKQNSEAPLLVLKETIIPTPTEKNEIAQKTIAPKSVLI
jgi:hypothetical protein